MLLTFVSGAIPRNFSCGVDGGSSAIVRRPLGAAGTYGPGWVNLSLSDVPGWYYDENDGRIEPLSSATGGFNPNQQFW